MNTIAKQGAGTAVAALQSLKTGLANVHASIPQRVSEPFLRLEKSGGWVYGSDNIEVEDQSLWAVNPLSIKHGYACWTRYDAKDKKKNVLLGERMVQMTEPKPDKSKLPAFADERGGGDWEWSDQVSFMLRCMSGEDEGEQVLFKTTSVGGLDAVSKLTGEIMKQLDKDAARIVPVVELLSDHYTHTTWGKTYVPIFAIRDWVPLTDDLPTDIDEAEGEEPATEQPVEQQAAEPPAGRRRGARASVPETGKAAEPEKPAEQQAAADAPRRRRRVS